MSFLAIYAEQDASRPQLITTDGERIARELEAEGIRFERWTAGCEMRDPTDQAQVLAAYADDVARLKSESGFVTADVIGLTPDHPEREALRGKFLDEHRHAEHEVRFFVRGSGIFYLHLGKRVLAVGCEKDDLIAVPAGTPHWFDMGPTPDFTAIRLFTNPEGWIADFTTSDIAARFPRHEALAEHFTQTAAPHSQESA